MSTNAYNSGAPAFNAGDPISALALERMREADQRALPQKGIGTFIRQTPNGSVVSAFSKRISRLPCCMGFEPYFDPDQNLQPDEDPTGNPPYESTFWIGHSDNPAHANYNSGDPRNSAGTNKTCFLQNFWLRAERNPEDAFWEFSDYEGGYWGGNPDKFGALDIHFNGYDGLISLFHGHPTTGYHLNYMKEGAAFGSWNHDWIETDDQNEPVENAAWENASQFCFFDPNHLQSSNPRLEIYKDQLGGNPQGGYSWGEKLLWYGGTLLAETWSDGTNKKDQGNPAEEDSNYFRQLIKADAWKSYFIVFQGNDFKGQESFMNENRYCSFDANYPSFTVYSDNSQNDYSWGYQLDYRAAELKIETWTLPDDPAGDRSKFNQVKFVGYEPSFVIYSGDFSEEGSIGENYFAYQGSEGLLSLGDSNSENFVSFRINHDNDEASFWIYDKGGNNLKYDHGIFHCWLEDGTEYKLYESNLWLQNNDNHWLEIQTSTIFMSDGVAEGMVYPTGASFDDGKCVIDGAAIFLEGGTNWSESGIWFGDGNTGLEDGGLYINGQSFVPRDFTDCDGNTITVLAVQ